MGASVNVITGYLISRVQLRTLVVVSAFITMTAAPIMATIDVHESYWTAAFWGLLLSPVNPDGTLAIPLLCARHDECLKEACGFVDRDGSSLHRLEPRNLKCLPCRRPITRRRRLQRDLSVWQFRGLGRYRCHCVVGDRTLHLIRSHRGAFAGIPRVVLDHLCCNGSCPPRIVLRARKEWPCRQERRVRKSVDERFQYENDNGN
jgi:hypothetical protein